MTTKTPPRNRHNYFSSMLIDNTDSVIAAARKSLEPVNFDTFVVIGLSGSMAGALLAHALEKNLYVLRKPTDNTHDGLNGFGTMGRRWVFLDDFISGGTTYMGAYKKVYELWSDGVWDKMDWMPRAERWKTTKMRKPIHVGAYLYRDESFRSRKDALMFTKFYDDV